MLPSHLFELCEQTVWYSMGIRLGEMRVQPEIT